VADLEFVLKNFFRASGKERPSFIEALEWLSRRRKEHFLSANASAPEESTEWAGLGDMAPHRAILTAMPTEIRLIPVCMCVCVYVKISGIGRTVRD
jgi:hypothetical protein